MGSPVLDACMVACGSVDGYYIHGIQSWDIAAVAIIVREAGGVVMFPPLPERSPPPPLPERSPRTLMPSNPTPREVPTFLPKP